MKDIPLYPWSPRIRRGQINRYGLRPMMAPTISTNDEGWRQPVICFADTPSWAWALSGKISYTPLGEWDLWQTWRNSLTNPRSIRSFDRPSGIHEVRTTERVWKRDIWYVGSRVKL